MDSTWVYIDGFNLYHGLIRPYRLHWLDLEEFARRLNLRWPVAGIRYCTAMIPSSPDDPNKAQRQDAYHRALRIACPRVEILYGAFSRRRKMVPYAGCRHTPHCAVNAAIRTEKGSDVNLAARLVHDAHSGRFDRAIVVSGDTDLAEPIRPVTRELHKPVWVRNPRNVRSSELEAVATNYQRIRPVVLARSQLPDPVTDGVKSYRKPARWSGPSAPFAKTVVCSFACTQAGCANAITTFRYQ